MNLLESLWLKDRLARFPDAGLFPLLDAGSATLEFRTQTQPYIDANVFAPLRARGGQIIHADLIPDRGVDLVGDLLDPHFQRHLAKLNIRSILLANLLEHVAEPRQVAAALLNILPPNGLLFISGPRDYPYHPDPIDNYFRPTINEAHALFPHTTLLDSAIIDSGNWRTWNPHERGRTLGRTLLRLATPFYRPAKWWQLARQSPYLFKHITAFALILRKNDIVAPAQAANAAQTPAA